MSRHRSAYNDEDLYDYDDYDDYDDYYEEEYEQSNDQVQGTHAPASSLTIDLVSAERESAVSFIMETLGGTNFTKQQVSDAYTELGGNTTEVIDHLLHMQTVQMEVDEQGRENEATVAAKSTVTAANNTATAASASKGSPVTPTRRDRANSIGKSKSLTALSPTSAMRVQKHKATTFQEMGTKGSLGSKSVEKGSSSSSSGSGSSKAATPQSHAKPPLAPVSGGSKQQQQQQDKDSKSHSMVQSNVAMKAERERQQQQRVRGGGDKDDRDPLSYQPDKLAYVPQRVAPGQSKQAIDMSLMGFDSESHNSLAELDHPLSPRRRGSGIYGDDDGGDDYDVGPPISLRPVMSSPDMADMIGAGSGPGSLKPIPLSRSPSAILLTSNAVLSDEEWEYEEAMGDMQSKHNVHARRGLKSATGAGGETTSSATAVEEKSHMTLIVAGHVDAGKSTLLGNLLYKAKLVSQRSIHKFAKESQQIGKGSFALAWVMDGSASEREHGVTIDIAEKILTTESKVLTVLDAPGHRDFIPNMISGATFADCALLVIPASPGEYEKAMGPGAQTKEHAILLKALGVNQVLVAVNKMDMTLPEPWSQQRFEVVKAEVMQMLVQLQFKDTNIRFVPVSGLAGSNLVKEDDPEGLLKNLKTWYDGPCLLEALDHLRPPVRHIKKPLRAIVTSVVAEKDRGVIVRASIVQGTMRAQRGVGLTTCTGCATVKSIIEEESGNPLSMARAGDKGVVLTLSDRSGRSGEEMSMRSGVVLCKGPPLPPLATKFKASILTMPDITPPVIPGTSYYMYLHGQELLCVVKKIHSMTITTAVLAGKDDGTATLSTSSSKGAAAAGGYTTVVKKHPKCVAGGRSAVVTIEVERPVCIEPFTACKSLGRFALRATGGTCAVGVCDKVYSDDKDNVAKAFQF
jgi:elongation factor 1 alpha-like protein